MSPELSADLHKQGILSRSEAKWVYDNYGRIVANIAAMIQDGEPVF